MEEEKKNVGELILNALEGGPLTTWQLAKATGLELKQLHSRAWWLEHRDGVIASEGCRRKRLWRLASNPPSKRASVERTLAEVEAIVERADLVGNAQAAREHGADSSQVREWRSRLPKWRELAAELGARPGVTLRVLASQGQRLLAASVG